jgi:hypothetical protein
VTWLAVGLLMLDGVLLLLAGLWGGTPGLVVGGAACLVAAGLVGLWWRRHRRQAAEVEAARREVQAEVRALQALVGRKDR